jgi:SAM-dependent methyltransferase
MNLQPTRSERIRSFGKAVGDYTMGRPSYPLEAVRWAADGCNRALDIAAGTGKLTVVLSEVVEEVVALEPQHQMVLRLRGELPKVPVAEAVGEALPVATASVDLVTVAQAFHWFDEERAVPEIARALRPDGRLALLWNVRDQRVSWVAEINRIAGSDNSRATRARLRKLRGFTPFEVRNFGMVQEMDRKGLVALVRSRSSVAALPAEAQELVVARVERLCDEHPDLAGRSRFRMPYITEVYRAARLS